MPASNLRNFLQSLGRGNAAEATIAHTVGAKRWDTVLAGTDPATRIHNKADSQGQTMNPRHTTNLVSVPYVSKAEITDIRNAAVANGLSVNDALYTAALSEASSS